MQYKYNIEQGKFLRFENVVSFRDKLNMPSINKEVEKFKKLIIEKEAREIGPMISTTYSMEMINGQNVLDIEFLVQIDSPIYIEGPYRFLEVFQLTNALYTRYVGDPSEIEEVVNNMYSFIIDNKLSPIATLYNLNINNVNGTSTIDLYIPLNPNKL